MCLYPKLIENPKYKANKKNGGVIPPLLDDRVKYVPIGCQKCMECRKQKARAWQVRLQEDIRHNTNGKFVTLTFTHEAIGEIGEAILDELEDVGGYELDHAIAKQAVRWFLERWRKKYKRSLRHWLITELGHEGTERLHLHGIIWTDKPLEEVERIWKYGWVWKGNEKQDGTLENYVNDKTINYIIKYVTKTDQDHKYYQSIILTSPGIGANYTQRLDYEKNAYKENGTTNELYRTRTGAKVNMPIYWRNKRYSEQEREKLWIQKIDKNERWIDGVKLPADKHELIWAVLQVKRELNKELGYGDDEKDWDREQYENQLRKLKRNIQKTKPNKNRRK